MTEQPAARDAVDPPDATPRRHFIVRGDTPKAYRLIEELTTRYDGFVIAVVGPSPNHWTQMMRRLSNVEVITAERLDTDVLAAARLSEAEALALMDEDDAANVEAALLAQELNPRVRIVIRMFKLSLGERISELLNDCAVLSAASIAAPAFVAAALDEPGTPPITLGDRTVVGIRRDQTRPEDVVAGLAVLGPRGSEAEVLPADADERADLVLAYAKPAAPVRVRKTRTKLWMLPLIFGRRLRLVLAIFLVLFALGTAVLAWAQGIGWSEAAYSTLITELTGNAAPDVNGVAKVAVILMTMVSIGLIPALTATIVDSLVRARLQREAGGLHEPVADHVVVVGLGDVGTRVTRALCERGVDVVAIERDPEARGIQVARDLRVPVVIADATRGETLDAASVATCRALVVASTDDVANLETALLARTARPDLRVVLRLFDGEFANRVRQTFNINISRSVSYLAAPAFAAAMIGRQVIATIPVRRRVLLLADLPVGHGSALDRQHAATANRPHEARLLAVRTAEGVIWNPPADRPLSGDDRLVVAATRAGLGHLMADITPSSRTPEAPAAPSPARGAGRSIPAQPAPVDPGEPVPVAGPHLAEGPDGPPPFGPADVGSTRRA